MRIVELERQMNLLKAAATIPLEIDKAFRSRFDIPIMGTYLPTLTSVTNIASSTPATSQFVKIGQMVLVSGRVSVDPTATGTTQLGISLPFPRTFVATNDCAGTAVTPDIVSESAAIMGDIANGRAEMTWKASSLASRDMYYIFLYK